MIDIGRLQKAIRRGRGVPSNNQQASSSQQQPVDNNLRESYGYSQNTEEAKRRDSLFGRKSLFGNNGSIFGN